MENLQTFLDQQFDQTEDHIYLNHAAIAPWPKATEQAVASFVNENARRGGIDYQRWEEKKLRLRQQLAQLIGASVDEIALVKNTSEAISMVAGGLSWKAGDKVVISDQEFPSNRMPWQALQSKGVELIEVSLTDQPEKNLIQAINDPAVKLLSVSSVMYATGLRLDLEQLGQACQKNNVLFSIDAIQSVGLHPIDVQKIYADFVMADGHKWMLAPEGVGLFFCSDRVRQQLALTQFGWHMLADDADYEERNWQAVTSGRRFECGSPNNMGIHALSASLEVLQQVGLERISTLAIANAQYLKQQLSEIDEIQWRELPGSFADQTAIISFQVTAIKTVVLHQILIDAGVICACRAGYIRLSPHFYHSQSKLDQAVERIKQAVKSLLS